MSQNDFYLLLSIYLTFEAVATIVYFGFVIDTMIKSKIVFVFWLFGLFIPLKTMGFMIYGILKFPLYFYLYFKSLKQ